ncbi:Hypothetical predicted protein [Pelobates cultripes]|uniref:Uncharacterized protein n=1 Tax=Pelobates cultripes TaxID=61616 RepID=A0AAD1WE82_PELCU|nr:Hypothetical predicted protein [Pelobates cultripes]
MTYSREWEKELGHKIPQQRWKPAFNAHKKNTHCASHRELIRKIMTTWYLVPALLAHMFSTSTNRECSVIKPYWDMVAERISKELDKLDQAAADIFLLIMLPDSPNTKGYSHSMYGEQQISRMLGVGNHQHHLRENK